MPVAPVGSPLFDQLVGPGWPLFAARVSQIMKNMKNHNGTRDRGTSAQKSSCGPYGVKAFFCFATPLTKYCHFDPKSGFWPRWICALVWKRRTFTPPSQKTQKCDSACASNSGHLQVPLLRIGVHLAGPWSIQTKKPSTALQREGCPALKKGGKW